MEDCRLCYRNDTIDMNEGYWCVKESEEREASIDRSAKDHQLQPLNQKGSQVHEVAAQLDCGQNAI